MTFENTRPVTSVTLPAATGGYGTNPVRIYTATPLPPGLTFDPATRAITGTPTTIGSTTVNYRVVDAGEAIDAPRSATVTFDIVVEAVVNTAPTAFTLSLNPAAGRGIRGLHGRHGHGHPDRRHLHRRAGLPNFDTGRHRNGGH